MNDSKPENPDSLVPCPTCDGADCPCQRRRFFDGVDVLGWPDVRITEMTEH